MVWYATGGEVMNHLRRRFFIELVLTSIVYGCFGAATTLPLFYLMDNATLQRIVVTTLIFLVAGDLCWWLVYRGVERTKATCVVGSGILAGILSISSYVAWICFSLAYVELKFADILGYSVIAILLFGPWTMIAYMLAGLTNYVLLEKYRSTPVKGSVPPPT
jgi:hypothetical protein